MRGKWVEINDNFCKLDYGSPIPLYYQLKEIILDKIESGEWAEGTVIPSENDFQEKCEISRATVRRTMEILVNEGLLEKKRGKGTFVRKPKLSEELPQLKSFTEEMMGRDAHKKVIAAKYINPSPKIRKTLNLDQGQEVLFLKRLMFVDKTPLGILYEYIPARLGLTPREDYSKSLYRIFEEYGVYPKEADQIIEASNSTRDEVALMGLRKPFQTLVIKRIVYSSIGEPMEYVEGVYHGSRYRYQLRLFRNKSPATIRANP